MAKKLDLSAAPGDKPKEAPKVTIDELEKTPGAHLVTFAFGRYVFWTKVTIPKPTEFDEDIMIWLAGAERVGVTAGNNQEMWQRSGERYADTKHPLLMLV